MVFIINPATVFTIVAGITTVVNNKLNGAGNPTRSNADAKNVIPDTRVPAALTTTVFILDCNEVLSSNLISKYTATVVTILSIIFGINPIGNLLVIPENIPVAIPDAIQEPKLFLLRLITRIRVIKEKSICIGKPKVGVT